MSLFQNIDFELEQYLKEVNHEVNALAYSEEEGATKEDKFTEYIMETLAEAGETEGIRLCHYEKENRWENTQFKINGYALEEGYETLDIFVSSYRDSHHLWNTKKPEFDGMIKWSTAFINAAFKGHLSDIEPSSEAYGLAGLLKKHSSEFIRVNVFILSNGNISFDPPKKFVLKGLEELTFNFHIWDIERLHRLNQSKYNREPIEIDFEETLDSTIPCLSMPSENELYECYLAIVPGKVLAALYRNYGTRLLESNVRAFLQQTGKVNKGIRDTIRNEPFMFLPYNNGLATTAQQVKTKVEENGQLVITGVKDFQIVNGGQTTASLFHTEKKHKADLSKVFVQMKLTVIKDAEKKNESVPFISRYANSQNKVSELDLTSNNPFLQRVEELSRTTFAIDPHDSNKQTIWFFERVKGQYKEALNKEPTKGKQEAFKLKYPKNQVILKSQIARHINIWKQLPHQVAKGGQKNYNHFLKETEKEFKKKMPGRVWWEDLVANAILFAKTDELFGSNRKGGRPPIGDTNIKSYTVAYTLSYIHHLTENKLNLGLFWKTQSIPETLLKELEKGLKHTYNFLINLDSALVSEAAKADKTWTKLKENSNHPFDMDIVKSFQISEEDWNSRYTIKNDDTEEIKRYDNLEKITSLGLKFWDGLTIYTVKEDILSPYQKNMSEVIRKKLKEAGTLTDREIAKGMEVVNLLKEKSVDFDKVSLLSKFEGDDQINPSSLFNRLNKLKSEDWKRIIDLGEQTNSLTFNEISVIRTVIKKLKQKESIDLKRLKITGSAIDKLKKFGIKY